MKEHPSFEPPRGDPEQRETRHLNPGVSPIFACLGDTIDFLDDYLERGKDKDKRTEIHPLDIPRSTESDFIDFYERPSVLRSKGMITGGEQSWVISEVNDRSKYSLHYKSCTGVIVAGIDKQTGENISFLSHQSPTQFLAEGYGREKFTRDLSAKLAEMKDRCEPGTVDAVISSGNYLTTSDEATNTNWQQLYIDSIHLLSEQIKTDLGFEPLVIAGPKTDEGSDKMFYDNEHRRLYVLRPENMFLDEHSGHLSYPPRDIGEQSKKWE